MAGMEIELSPAEYERLIKLTATADPANPDVQFLAALVLRLINAAEREADYQREQAEY